MSVRAYKLGQELALGFGRQLGAGFRRLQASTQAWHSARRATEPSGMAQQQRLREGLGVLELRPSVLGLKALGYGLQSRVVA